MMTFAQSLDFKNKVVIIKSIELVLIPAHHEFFKRFNTTIKEWIPIFKKTGFTS
jgi:hypothetical protein